MSEFAVVKLGSSQHKISVGDIVITDLLKKEVGDKFAVSDVYLHVSGDKVSVGNPTIDIPVEFEVVSHGKTKKVRVHKFKAKSRYNLTRGSRNSITTLKVLSIAGVGEKKNVTQSKSVAKAEKVESKANLTTSKTASKLKPATKASAKQATVKKGVKKTATK